MFVVKLKFLKFVEAKRRNFRSYFLFPSREIRDGQRIVYAGRIDLSRRKISEKNRNSMG